MSEQFTSERWDINHLINNDDGKTPDLQRLFALTLLWRGRANDIEDRHAIRHDVTEAELESAKIYRACADELIDVLRLLYPGAIESD